MLNAGLRPNAATFNTIISTLVEGGELDKALTIFKLMGSRYSSGPPNSNSYNILIYALADAKRPDEAELLLKAMNRSGLRPQVELYTAVVTAHERTGKPLKAIQLMEQMREDGYEFYDVKVLNSAFKRLIKLANQLGKGLSGGGGR